MAQRRYKRSTLQALRKFVERHTLFRIRNLLVDLSTHRPHTLSRLADQAEHFRGTILIFLVAGPPGVCRVRVQTGARLAAFHPVEEALDLAQPLLIRRPDLGLLLQELRTLDLVNLLWQGSGRWSVVCVCVFVCRLQRG